MAPPAVVRLAHPGDLDALTGVFLACWTRSYAAFLPPATVAVYDIASAQRLWARHLRPRVSPGLWVAQGGDEVVGMALLQFPDPRSEPAYLASLYVHPEAQGSGAGSALFRRVCLLAADAGYLHLRWWVFAANAAAIGFYRQMGATSSGAFRVSPEYGQREIEMTVPIGAFPPLGARSSRSED